MQIHFPYISISVASVAGKQTAYTNALSNADWGVIYSNYLAEKALQFGVTLGATGSCQLYSPASGTGATFVMGTGALRHFNYNFQQNDTSFCTGPYTDFLTTSINCIKSGVVPMGFVPGIDIVSQQGLYGPKSIYNSFSLLLLQAVCANALQSKQGTIGFPATGTYPTLLSYIRNKILAPCDITPENSSFGVVEGTGSVTSPYMDVPWRRTYVQSTGWYASTTNVDPSYIPVANSLVWSLQYPNDGISLTYNYIKNITSNDPLAPGFDSNLLITPRKYLNLVKMILNKGVYNGNRIFSRSYWNYITQTAVAIGVNIFESGNGLVDYIGPGVNYTILGVARMNNSFNSANDPISINFSNTIPETSGGTIVGNGVTNGASPSSMYWFGAYGSICVFDVDTGNYMFMMLPQNGQGTTVNPVSVFTNFTYLTKYI